MACFQPMFIHLTQIYLCSYITLGQIIWRLLCSSNHQKWVTCFLLITANHMPLQWGRAVNQNEIHIIWHLQGCTMASDFLQLLRWAAHWGLNSMKFLQVNALLRLVPPELVIISNYRANERSDPAPESQFDQSSKTILCFVHTSAFFDTIIKHDTDTMVLIAHVGMLP